MSNVLQSAIESIRAGDKETGKRLLIQVVRVDPKNQAAWLWMTEVVDSDVDRVNCLQNVLEINPHNEAAKRGVTILRRQQIDQFKQSDIPQVDAQAKLPEPTLAPDYYDVSELIAQAREQLRRSSSRRSAPIWTWAVIIVVGLLVVSSQLGSGVIDMGTNPTARKSIVNTQLILTPTATPIRVPFECEDPLGCVTYGPNKPIRIATLLVISGPNTELGLDSQHGVEVAVELYGKVLGHTVELQFEDDMCNAEGGQISAQKIVSNPSIIAIVGTSCSGAGVPASKVVSDAGYVMISPSNTSPVLTDPDQAWNPGYLRTAHNDMVQGRAMARFALEELGVTSAAAIHDGSPYTEGLARAFADSFEEMGGEIIAFEIVGKGDTDMRPALTAVSEAGPPEFIYYPIFIAEGAAITTQASEIAGLENTILSGADGMQSPAFIEAAGDSAEGMYVSGPDLSFSSVLYDQFLETYENTYGTPPTTPFHAHAFDATCMILNAIKEVAVQDEDGTIHIGRQALRDALYTTKDFEGLTGNLTCDQYGDCANLNVTVSQIMNGEFVPIWSE